LVSNHIVSTKVRTLTDVDNYNRQQCPGYNVNSTQASTNNIIKWTNSFNVHYKLFNQKLMTYCTYRLLVACNYLFNFHIFLNFSLYIYMHQKKAFQYGFWAVDRITIAHTRVVSDVVDLRPIASTSMFLKSSYNSQRNAQKLHP
jgi:hypothetical protein